MSEGLTTYKANLLLTRIKQDIRHILNLLDKLNFESIPAILSLLREELRNSRMDKTEDEAFLNDLFVVNAYINLIERYKDYWHRIISGENAASWNALHDAIDSLRLVKRFSNINVAFFERQLVQLESIYPYSIFFSIGMSVSRFECSICGENIDSFRCLHRIGELYMGTMASAIAQDGVELDHVSIVKNPVDKRCVQVYSEDSPGFNAVRYLSNLLTSGKASVLSINEFSEKKFSDRNPSYIKQRRNEKCFCGSSKKFKICCIDKEFIKRCHVDIIGRPTDVSEIVP